MVYIDGLVQDCSNSIASAMELLQSYTKPSICCVILIINDSYVETMLPSSLASHEKINGHRGLTVTTVVTAPGPNDDDSVTARRGHSSVTARSQLSHGYVTAQSGRGHSSITASSVWSRLSHG